MAKKQDPIEVAAKKLDDAIANRKTAKATVKSATSTFLLTLLKTVIIPALGPLLGEVLAGKDGKKKYSKYLIPAREILINADLGDA